MVENVESPRTDPKLTTVKILNNGRRDNRNFTVIQSIHFNLWPQSRRLSKISKVKSKFI